MHKNEFAARDLSLTPARKLTALSRPSSWINKGLQSEVKLLFGKSGCGPDICRNSDISLVDGPEIPLD